MVQYDQFYNRKFLEHMRSVANALLLRSFGMTSYVNSSMVKTVHYTTGVKEPHGLADKRFEQGDVELFLLIVGRNLGCDLRLLSAIL